MPKITIYHGSSNIIETPKFGFGKTYNDYGQGFYCTQYKELAKEWACTENIDGYSNHYEIETDSLNILNLQDKKYSVLHWLALLVKYRKFSISSPIMDQGTKWLLEHFLLDLSDFDIVIGYRADDSYFSFAKAFLQNTISLNQLSYAMKLGNLGEQFVLKSKKAFDLIKFIDSEIAYNKEFYPKRKSRDENARNDFKKELAKSDLEGIFIRDLIRQEVSLNDSRLQ